MKLIRKTLPLLIAALLFAALLLPLHADEPLVLYTGEAETAAGSETEAVPVIRLPHLLDGAGLLTADEAEALEEKLVAMSEQWDFDFTVATVDSLGYKDVVSYADDLYDDTGWRNDGILLLISMEERDWAMSTKGLGISIFGDSDLGYIEDKMLPKLSSGNYAGAFTAFADNAEQFVAYAKQYGYNFDENGYWANEPYVYDEYEYNREPDYAKRGVFSAVIGAIVGLISTGSMKSKMKTVKTAHDASRYMRKDSLNLSRSNEVFLYNNVVKTPKSEEARGGSSHHGGGSFHTSSSGSSHGGSHGKF